MPELVTVSARGDALEAHLVRIYLEDAGIASYLEDENIVNMNWRYTCAVNGVKIQVSDEDLSEATRVLVDLRSRLTEHEEEVDYPCPKCSSRNVEITRFKKRLALCLMLITGIPFPFIWRALTCRDCGLTWQPTAPGDSPFPFVLPLIIMSFFLAMVAVLDLGPGK